MAQRGGYNTNLAAEFHVLSVLHRLGLSASLTLSHRKAIDIVVESRGRLFTIDVKGMATGESCLGGVFNDRKIPSSLTVYD